MPSIPFSSQISSHLQAVGVAGGLVMVATVVFLVLRRSRPSAEAIEYARRTRLALMGRITDGSLIDTTTLDGNFVDGPWFPNNPNVPAMLQFHYRIAGVAYEAVQDVSTLTEKVRGLRIDLPIQVRYDHQNPADSIVVAEDWSGLQTRQESPRVEWQP